MQPETETSPASNRIWGPWPTVGFSLAIFAMYSTVQGLVALVVMFQALFAGPAPSLSRLTTELASNGLLISLATILSAIAGLGLIAMFIKFRGIGISQYLGLKPMSGKTVLVSLGLTVALMVLITLVGTILKAPDDSEFAINAYKTVPWPPLLWMALVLFAPAFEECFFRGFLLVGLKQSRLGVAGAIALTALPFALLHIQYGAFGIGTVLVLGIAMGVMRVKSGSLWSPLLMHATWNLIGVVQTALIVNGVMT